MSSSCSFFRHTYLLWAFLLIVVGAVVTTLLPLIKQQITTYNDKNIRHQELSMLHNETACKEIPAKEQEVESLNVEQFTLIMQTYNRTDILLRLLTHYQAMPNLRQIIIVWNNVGTKTPQELWESSGPHPVPVVFKEQTTNLVGNRLRMFPEIDTEAVLMLDDDLLIGIADLSLAFSVWKQFPERIVGFVPRKHVIGRGGLYSYSTSKGRDGYSMVLIGAAFFLRRYLKVFEDQPAVIHSLIDSIYNCDDIAMNFIIAVDIKSRSPPDKPCTPVGVFVKPVSLRNLENQARSGLKGLWRRPQHFRQRSDCLNKLTGVYGFMPLCFSNVTVSHFSG